MESIEKFFLNILEKIKLKKIADLYRKYIDIMRYLIFGVLTTIINIVVYIICFYLFGIENIISNVIAWILTVIVAYLTNKDYVFHSTANTAKAILTEVTLFFASRLLTLGIDELIMYISVDKFQFNGAVMKIISNIIVIIANYIFSKIIVFKNRKA